MEHPKSFTDDHLTNDDKSNLTKTMHACTEVIRALIHKGNFMRKTDVEYQIEQVTHRGENQSTRR